MVRSASAGILMAGLLSACVPSAAEQPNAGYVRYMFTCCTANDGQGAWRPGDTVDVQWIVGTTRVPNDGPPRSIVLSAELQGPYATVDELKTGSAPVTTLTATPITTDDQDPAVPTSHITLPATFRSGLYKLAFSIDYGQGNSMSGASVLQVGATGGADPFAALSQRPLKLPGVAATARCPATSSGDLGDTAPNYGYGSFPAYLSGQSAWYSGGQVGVIMVDPAYSGPLLIRAAGLGSAHDTRITLTDIQAADGSISKEAQHGVTVVSAVHTSDGQVELQESTSSPSWRGWFGWLETGGAGCFGLQVDGTSFSEVIVINVQSGPPPAG